MADLRRRHLLLAGTGLLSAYALPSVAGLRPPTPSQPTGPFYPAERPLDDDSDLTRVPGQQRPARGQTTDLAGHIFDRNGQALRGLRIEIWQCDANGRYRHPRDSGVRPIDPGFQGSGHAVSDAQGRYRFRTIRPVPYPGRTPHIHVAVFPAGERPFVTQLYVTGEPRNADDFLYQRVPEEQRRWVTTEFTPAGSGEVDFTAAWDIVLGITPT